LKSGQTEIIASQFKNLLDKQFIMRGQVARGKDQVVGKDSGFILPSNLTKVCLLCSPLTFWRLMMTSLAYLKVHLALTIDECCLLVLAEGEALVLHQTYSRLLAQQKLIFLCLGTRVVDPHPDWIRIQRLCGSGSVLGIRIRIQGEEN
jgi:hypothetical protein